MSYLGRHYRTYALDFWGFGESGKKRETYAVQDFVSLVDQFMDQDQSLVHGRIVLKPLWMTLQQPQNLGRAWLDKPIYRLQKARLHGR